MSPAVTYEESAPYLDWPNDAGFNASEQVHTPMELRVDGRLPACVAGTLYRTGPGHYKLSAKGGEYKMSHWFDGFTVIHRFQLIEDGSGSCKVMYNSRGQVDDLLEKVRKTGKLDGISFGQKRDPCESFFGKLKCSFKSSRTTNPLMQNIGVTIGTNPAGFQINGDAFEDVVGSREAKGRSFAVVRTDTSQMKTINLETLEPIGCTEQKTLHPELKGPLSSAHAEVDRITGDVFNYNLNLGRVGTYKVFKTSLATGKTEILATIANPNISAAYIHSFFLSEDFVILGVWSSHFTAYGIKILLERNILDAMAPFDPKAKSKWIVVDRKHGRGVIATFESPAMFSFHAVNAWQEPSKENAGQVDIICDVVSYSSLDVLHSLYYENLTSTGSGALKATSEERAAVAPSLSRFKLPNIIMNNKPTSSIVRSAELVFRVESPLVGELPTINPLYNTKASRYVYSLVSQGVSSFVDGISKFDTLTGEVSIWTKSCHTPGEALFIPDPARQSEDGGFLLSVILDGRKGTSYLLFLNAETMKEVGRAECEVAVGFGFHGTHVAR